MHELVQAKNRFLASVSHDLRTPLTRLKLTLALAEPNGRTAEMKRDLAEMEHMIDEYLAFARGEGGEAPEAIAEGEEEGAGRKGLAAEQDPSQRVQRSFFEGPVQQQMDQRKRHGIEHRQPFVLYQLGQAGRQLWRALWFFPRLLVRSFKAHPRRRLAAVGRWLVASRFWRFIVTFRATGLKSHGTLDVLASKRTVISRSRTRSEYCSTRCVVPP